MWLGITYLIISLVSPSHLSIIHIFTIMNHHRQWFNGISSTQKPYKSNNASFYNWLILCTINLSNYIASGKYYIVSLLIIALAIICSTAVLNVYDRGCERSQYKFPQRYKVRKYSLENAILYIELHCHFWL